VGGGPGWGKGICEGLLDAWGWEPVLCMSICIYITSTQILTIRFLSHQYPLVENSASLNPPSHFVIRIPRARLTRNSRPTIASRHACVGRIALVSVTDSSTPL